jgi:hypothetical protein
MPRLTPDQWAEARALWEADPTASAPAIAGRFGCTPQALRNRIRAEGWTKVGTLQRVAELAQMRARDGEEEGELGGKVSGAITLPGPKKFLADAVEAAIDQRAKVIERHREEWKIVRLLRQEALADRAANVRAAFNRAKLAKITAEMTAIQQAGERKAWGFDEGTPNAPAAQGGLLTINIVREEYGNVINAE